MRHDSRQSRYTPVRSYSAARAAPLLAILVAAAACGGAGARTTDESRATEADSAPQARLVPGTRSTPSFDEATATIEQPKVAAIVNSGTLSVQLGVGGFTLGEMTPGAGERGIAVSDKGQHLHLVLDDRPYVAVYDVGSPVTLDSVGPGRHVLFAFPSRAWHESVKHRGALAVTTFTATEPGGTPHWDSGPAANFEQSEPFLVYSRPKGRYEGAAADSVLVDFYLGNVDLSPDGYKVRVRVDGRLRGLIARWEPWYLLNLPDGEHEVTLELLDPRGNLVPGPFNRTSRVITIARETGSPGS